MQEERRVKNRYYKNSCFCKLDRALKRAYFLQNPYTISRKFMTEKREKEVHVYGETPLTSLESIAKKCALSSNDHLIDLGCGRGRALFFLVSHFGCTGEGIDWVPTFIEKAKQVVEEVGERRLAFCLQNLAESDLSKASVLYLAGTCMEEKDIASIIRATEKLKQGAKVISVSFPLEAAHLKLQEEFQVPFLWDTAAVFLHTKI